MIPQTPDCSDNALWYVHGNKFTSHALPPLHPALVVRPVPSSHPAYPGFGVYASAPIAANTDLGYYAGIVRHMLIADTTPYSFAVNTHWVVDALSHRNALAYVNDPRGTPNEGNPNVDTQEVQFKGSLWTVLFFTVRDVAVGEELCFPYGGAYSMEMNAKPWMLERPAVNVDEITDPHDAFVKVKTEPGTEEQGERGERAEEQGPYVSFVRAYQALAERIAHPEPSWMRVMKRVEREYPEETEMIIYKLDKVLDAFDDVQTLNAELSDEFKTSAKDEEHPLPPGVRRCSRCRVVKVLHKGIYSGRSSCCNLCVRRRMGKHSGMAVRHK